MSKTRATTPMISRSVLLHILVLGLLGMGTAGHSKSNYKKPSTAEKFNRVIGVPMAVAMFYSDDVADQSKQGKRALKSAKQEFKAVSKEARYKDVGIRFVLADLSRSKMSGIGPQYGIKRVPEYVLFENGREVSSVAGDWTIISVKGFQMADDSARDGKRNTLVVGRDVTSSGYLTAIGLRRMIEEEWGDEINEELERQRAEEQALREARASAPTVIGSPYYGYYGGWYGPWWDYEWGWPRRRYWRSRWATPGVGFGITVPVDGDSGAGFSFGFGI